MFACTIHLETVCIGTPYSVLPVFPPQGDTVFSSSPSPPIAYIHEKIRSGMAVHSQFRSTSIIALQEDSLVQSCRVHNAIVFPSIYFLYPPFSIRCIKDAKVSSGRPATI